MEKDLHTGVTQREQIRTFLNKGVVPSQDLKAKGLFMTLALGHYQASPSQLCAVQEARLINQWT